MSISEALCEAIVRAGCCPHPRSMHIREIMILGDLRDAYRACEGCEDVGMRAMKGDAEADARYIDPEHAYRGPYRCKKPEHPSMAPNYPHERAYGHAFLVLEPTQETGK